MWTLFVISIVYANDKEVDLRYVRYKEFDTLWECSIAADKLEKTFNSKEISICYQTSREVRPDTLY
jgi:hypothetical protein